MATKSKTTTTEIKKEVKLPTPEEKERSERIREAVRSFDFTDKPFTSKQMYATMLMYGSKAAILRMERPDFTPTREEIAAFVPTASQVETYLLAKANGIPKEGPVEAPPKTDASDKRFKEKYQDYQASYDLRKPNHRDTVVQIVNMRLRLEDIQSLLYFQKNTKEFYSKQRKEFVEEEKTLTSMVKQLEESLGLTKAQMDKARQDSSAPELVQSYVDRTREMMKDRLIPFSHCRVQLGWMIFHFGETQKIELSFVCPRCKQEVSLVHGAASS